ncbi:MAG: hypothetical protein A2W68_05730 [Betaproteobacteria bacterium RIFCSPLOWO2_02_64_14]|nr:MAG: hypothetical protein A2W68_05730 [Betaproteobacteria bacterium RIFCSPLOWO2_02_64_14]
MHSFSRFGPLDIVSCQLLLGWFWLRSLSHLKSDKLLGKGKYAGDENCQGVTLDAELAMDLLLDHASKITRWLA